MDLWILIVIIVLIVLASSVKIVQEYERGVIFRIGRLVGARGPGLFFVIPILETMRKVDLRTVALDIPPQEVITNDHVTIHANAIIYYRVMDPSKALVMVENYPLATAQIALTRMRDVIGQVELGEMLSGRDKINKQLQASIEEATDPWGIKVSAVEIKSVELPETSSNEKSIASANKNIEEGNAAFYSGDIELGVEKYQRAIGIFEYCEEELKANELRERIINGKKEKIRACANLISTIESEITVIKTEGIETSELEELLLKSKQAFDTGDYKKALKYIKQAEDAIEKIKEEEQKQNYSDFTPSLESELAKVKREGIETPEPEELLLKSRRAFDDKNYEHALEYAKQAEDAIKKLKEQSRPKITTTLPKETFQPNQWKRTEITIQNIGSIPARDIRVEPSGDIEFRDSPTIQQLGADETETITFAMKPTAVGDVPIDVAVTYRDAFDRDYKSPDEVWIITVAEQAPPPEPTPARKPAEIEIKRGYEVLPNNDLRFGIRVINPSDYVILDVEAILDYPKTLFSLKGDVIQTLANIPPNGERTAKYVLTPLGCVHQEKIDAIVRYDDHAGEKHTVQMLPKEVHCVCPFLREKAIREGEFANLAAESTHLDAGVSFSGISVGEIVELIRESCAHRLYLIGEHEHVGKVILYLAGESIGEKAYYLLTTVVGDYEGVTQVALRAYSDKMHGLRGFLNEMTGSLRQLVGSVQSAKEIGVIEKKQVINIIDSVVQRTSFGGGDEVNVRDSVVNRSDIGSMTCPNCGAQVQEGAEFCTECGAKVDVGSGHE